MTTSTAEEKDGERRSDSSLARARLSTGREKPAGAEPIEHDLDPGAEPAATGRRGRQIDYL